jgi:ribonuclease HII
MDSVPGHRPLMPDPWGGILGIDEAGRGSVLGPLVVGGFRCPRDRVASLPELGARDSKAMSPAAREATYERLQGVGQCFTIVLAPPTIDRWVAHGGLNRLEARHFAAIVRRARAEEVYLDACDVDARRFGEEVGRLAGTADGIRSTHEADRRFAIVGAASIVAKVTRDRAVRRLARRLGARIGSGYPSDPVTVAFVRAAIAGGLRAAPWLRASWATTRRLMAEARVVPLERFAP